MSYKAQRSGLLNTEKRVYSGVGVYDIPEILPLERADVDGCEAVGFNYMFGEKHPEDKILHFFLDDYQFERVWKEPNKYIPYLQKFKYVVAPDFSLYTDHPKAVQIFNHYRKHWCARYWQDHGVNVIPCMCWSTPDSFEWCFDGEPRNSVVCVSMIGAFGNHPDNNKAGWMNGYNEMIKQLNPSQIVLFGNSIYEDVKRDCRMSLIGNAQLLRKKSLSARSVSPDAVSILTTNDLDNLEVSVI